MHTVSPGLVAYVQTKDGTVKLHEGDTVPASADENHVAALVKSGVLAKVEKPAGSRRSGGSGQND